MRSRSHILVALLSARNVSNQLLGFADITRACFDGKRTIATDFLKHLIYSTQFQGIVDNDLSALLGKS